ncbi:MAG: response regulator [Bacteriovoracia bacterium]
MTKKKILLVEDENSIREMIRCLLELEGYTVLTATNGKEGLEVLRGTSSLCLILLDMTMPKMNGWDFLDRLKADAEAANIPVVVMSAHQGSEVPRPNAFVQKPVQLNTLLNTVKRHCA